MDIEALKKTATFMMRKEKGILAADESERTAGKRLNLIGVENTSENRRKYRDLFLNTDGIEAYISAVILHEETLDQSNNEGVPFVDSLIGRDIVPGIKADKSTYDFAGFPGEKVTAGLDGLRERLQVFYKKGARFAKWRSVITIGEGIPTPECIHTNIIDLAQYARICQEEGIVPMVEPEVLLSGTHTIEKSEEILHEVISTLFYQLKRYKVQEEAVILKTSMVLPGSESGQMVDNEEVGERTVRVLKDTVPEYVPGIVFLSGGQHPVPATEHLDAITSLGPFPWELAFSYARALQGPSLEIWQGEEENIEKARDEFIKRLELAVAADMGVYTRELEQMHLDED